MSDIPELPRMRIRRGRVMHRVRVRGDWYESRCRRGAGIRGVSTTFARAYAPFDEWTTERYWYPDCQHCPKED